MAYIKIYNGKMIPIGVANTESIEVIEGAQRYAKIKNADGLVLGAINIDSEISQSEIQRLVTIYNEKMMPIGFADIANVMPKHDYSKDYFTTEALEDGTIAFNIWSSMGTDYITSISYSKDNGETWTTVNNENNKESNLQIEVDVEEGDKILWKGTAQQLGYYDEDEGDWLGSFFSSTCEFNAYGNVMSMLYGDNFSGRKTLSYDYIFAYLFGDYNEEQTCSIINASNISLPATTLAQYCYSSMFQGCTSLTTAPQLPATTLAQYCYSSMFQGCTSLTTAPQLPATTLAQYCYSSMFQGCTSLTTAPQLPATTLAQYCYSSMFYGCTSLNYIKALFTTTPNNSYTQNWVKNVAANGTFVKSTDAEWSVVGDNGVPTGWTIETA